MQKFLLCIIFSVIYFSGVEGMKRNLPKDTKSLIPLTVEQRAHCTRLVDHDVLLDDIQTNIALHMIIDFLLIPKTIQDHSNIVWSVAIQKDKVISGSVDRSAKMWNINTSQLLCSLAGPNGHTDEIWSVTIDNNKIVTGSRDHTARIWNVKTGKLLHILAGINGHTLGITSVKINGNKVITGSKDGTAKIWNINTGLLLFTLAGDHKHTDIIYAIATTGNKVVTASYDHTAKIWDINTGRFLRTLGGRNGHCREITAVTIGDNKVITGSADGTTKVWNIYNGQLLRTFTSPHEHTDIAISGKLVVTGSYEDCVAKVWHVDTGKTIYTLRGTDKHTAGIPSVAIQNNTVVTGSFDNTVKIWPLQLDLNTKEFANPEHALFWIKHYILPYQAHLIARAQVAKKFIINSKSNDALTWVTFPAHVRKYLLECLNIELTK